jgi:hypothetical protein
MCNNYPNCNCSSCSPCQSCTQVTPTCNCTTTCTCTTEQFTEECPCGLQSTNCLIYTGDNLKDCEGDDFIFRGTNFNTFLSQLWETVKCAATPSTDTIDYTGADIKTCDNNTTIVATGTPVTAALNNIWNYIKCWYTDLEELISDRQPVWKLSNTILVGPSQPVPFNTLPTALDEIAKYHFATEQVIISLQTGTYNLNTDLLITNKFQYNLIFTSQSGNKADVTINTGVSSIVVTNQSVFTMLNLTLTSTTSNVAGGLQVGNLSKCLISNCTITLPNPTTNNNYYYVFITEKAELQLNNLEVNTIIDVNKIKCPFYVSTFASLRADSCKFDNFSTICLNDFNSSSVFNNVQFANIYSTAFIVANNSSLFVSGNNNFDGENNPTGFENTVLYNESGSVFYAGNNSNIIVSNLRVSNNTLYAPNIEYVTPSGNVNDWSGNRVFISGSNSKIVSNLCYFTNFVLASSIDRNAILTLYASIFTELAYVYNGYIGQVSHGWSVTATSNVLDTEFYKNPAITNQLSPGVLNRPFSYDPLGSVTMSGWATTSPFIIT